MELTVLSRKPYPMRIERGIFARAGQLAAPYVGGRICVVTDDTVGSLYAGNLLDSLARQGIEPCLFTFPHGEENKNLRTYGELLSFLARSGITRSDALISLGGGVVSDLGAFAAATYMRGIDLIHIPTTLLGCVDAAVGGKAAVDLPEGKNLAGVFYQPKAVLCDPELLRTLPDDIFADGCAEVVKYAMMGALTVDALPARYEEDPLSWEAAIASCVRAKAELVSADETDRGVRRLLNFGHTIGHAAEAVSGYTLSHGKAVAMGMAAVTRGAVRCGECDRSVLDALCAMLSLFGLPTSLPYGTDELTEALLRDKKRSGDTVAWILPERVGALRIVPMDLATTCAFLADCVGDDPC